MILLAIETATLDVAAALVDDGETLAAFTRRGTRRHIETLHPGIDELFAATGRAPSDLAAVAVDRGPGLFTGLRVGIAAAKGFAAALELPIVGLSSMEILRVAAARRGYASAVPVIDMRRGEVAWSLVDGEIVLGTPEELAAALAAREEPGATPLVLVGDGAARHRELLCSLLGSDGGSLLIAPDELLAPPVEILGAIACERVADGEFEDAFALAPEYLREADARANFATREGVVVK